jgi:hypothetical protein
MKKPLLIAGVFALLAALFAAGASARYTTKGAWSFFSSSLHPPKLHADVHRKGKLAAGYFLTTSSYNEASPQAEVGQGGPLMLDSNLQPVWFRPIPAKQTAFNLQAQTYNGKPVLTWWQGTVNKVGVTVSGEDLVVNQHYRAVIKPLVGKFGWVISPHDFVISGNVGWVTAYKTLKGINLAPYGGKANGTLLDTAVQEYDLKTGKLLYSWDAYNPGGTPNVPLSDSKEPAPKSASTAWDAYHLNSVQAVGANEFLASIRNTWSAYLVSVPSGKIVWTLSGNPKLSSFSMPAKARFHWQHHVELHPGNVISIYDDACCATLAKGIGPASGPSRGLILKLDMTKRTASFVAQYTHGAHFDSVFLGSTQQLPGGNVLVGWGSLPYFSEFSKSGKMLLDVVWPGPDLSYRALFAPHWVGLPLYPPSGAASRNGKTVYASWNGATRVSAWRVLSGSSSSKVKTVAVSRASRTGFETAIKVSKTAGWYSVQALDSSGHVLGTSKAFKG